MKTIFYLLIFLFICDGVQAQWTPQNSGTTQNLYDVDFYNIVYGLAGGDSGTVLFTDNGGANWTPLSVGQTGKVGSVHIVNRDTFLVSVIDGNGMPVLMYTFTQGLYWQSVFTDSTCYRAIDSDSKPDGTWFTSGSNILSSSNQGASWDTLASFTCGTNTIDRIDFANPTTLNGGGLISGFVTYSASMIRSDDGGNNIYSCDPFSFPNADALTAFYFPYPDTGMIFMNHYNGFMPGTSNSLVKTYGYYAAAPNPPDTMFYFTSAIVNTNMPGYMNDGFFKTTQRGFAACNDGNIYETTDGGNNWNITYNNQGNSINRLSFPDPVALMGYAVGNNGTILKYEVPNGIPLINEKAISIYPNPVKDIIHVDGWSSGNFTFKIYDLRGKKVLDGSLNTTTIDIKSLSSGSYFLELNSGSESVRKQFLVK